MSFNLMMQLSQKAITKNFDILFFLQGRNTEGQNIYVYVCVSPLDIDVFIEKSQLFGFRPGEYGKILSSGYGSPSEDEKERLALELGLSAEEL